ncbi:choice-of-anchor D domain-containing protein [Flavobacterium sp. MAH-1]|uniref:Choice-of-anchor D domain-containing protein n=1 Tax=Flavobacterium agri TaxID=2743471 RepID=A0A7Y8Y1X4_9FLAO|nr:choice-of-anchor D domain-containing protein [Flavobacterium agri]NUY80338.1 choice-of-anchor D domain-containing protein [Flavobacterium agri]NYA70363.1 choice-of-anchor D domain-containing protein [Flavobacterium agri]
MKLRIYLSIAFILLAFSAVNAQVMLTEAAPNVTVDFSASMQTTVGTNPSTAYKAAGFSPNPTIAGRLNSNAWDVRGFDFGVLGFGGTQTVDDFGRGQITNPVLTGGLYAYTELPGTVANPAFMVQPTDTDFNPGSIVLKLKNNGTTNLTQLTVSYNLFIRNDEGRASSFNFSHSSDDVVYQDEPSLDYISPEAPDAFQWTAIGVSPARSIIITGINIAPGGFYYLRWTSQDVSGTGDRDEFGLDDIQISAYYGAPAPEINVKGVSGVTVLTGDTTPTVAEGTDFAPIGSPLSTVGASLNTTFQIQNLGGALLNVSNITITGPQAADFSIYIPASNNLPTGDILPAGSGSNFRELTIKFDPSDEGLRKARVTIYNTDSNEGVYWFDIQGYGLIPKPDINVKGNTGGTSNITSGNMIPAAGNNTLWVADQIVGTSVSKDYRIQNTANIASILQLTGTPKVQIGGTNPGDFVVTTQPTSTNINGGFGSNFIITFTPQAAGIRTALVTIPNNDAINDPFTGLTESPYTFLIQGKGITPEIDITGNSQPIVSGSTTPTLINHTFFDYLNITGATLDRTYTIKNTGTAAMTIGALTITGVNASEFSIISSPSATLAINASTTFTIRFDPSSVGIKNAQVNLVNNDFDENPYTFAIRGYGLDYVPCAYGAVETISIQDFETSPATPTWTYSGTGYTVAAGTAYGVSGDSGTSSRFIGGRSLQVTNATSNVTFAATNTLLYSDIELSFRLASMSTNNTEGSDNTDKIIVAVSSNGGLTWSNELDLIGNANAKWSFTSGTGIITATYDGNNVVTSYTTATAGYITADGMSTIRLANLPKASNLMVRITLINNSAAEIWAIDNVSLFGRKEVTTTWNGAWTNGVPTQTTKAIFDADYNTSLGNITACKCQINAGKTLTIASGQYLSSESDIENAGSIIVQSGGSLVQRNDFATNIGNVTVRRNSTPMRLYDYTYWSSPVGGQTLYNLSPNTTPDKFYSFNTQINNWQSVPSSSIMTPGIGYIIRAPQTFTSTPQVYAANFVGSPNNGFVTPAVYNSIGTWNLVGNPYPSAINADTFLQLPGNSALLSGTIYFWTHNTPITNQNYVYNDYAAYNLLGGTGTMAAPSVGVNNTIPNGKIASGQGFFVVSHTPGNVTFNNSMRLTGNNTTFFRPDLQGHHNTGTVSVPGDIEKHRIWLDIFNDSGWFKQTLVGYAEGASNGIDLLFDGPFANGGNFLSLYSFIDQGQDTFAIQGRGLPFVDSDKVKLGYKTTAAGNFSIGLEGFDGLFENQNIYLEDKVLNIIHDLKQSPYAFTTSAGTFDTRFELRYTTEQLSTPEFDLQNSLTIAVNDNAIHLKSFGEDIESIAVYDLLGRNIYETNDVHSTDFTIRNVVSNQQSLIVKSKLANGAVISKKIIY